MALEFRYPIDDIQNIGLVLNFDRTDLELGTSPAAELADFISTEGLDYATLAATLSWTRITLNRGLFPTAGVSSRLSLRLALPGSDLEYYRINYNFDGYKPLGNRRGWVLGYRARLGYLNAYGKSGNPPFFQRFYAGGFGSVRGYEINSLGPISTPSQVLYNKDGTPDCWLPVQSDT